jgi:hypothetical protein
MVAKEFSKADLQDRVHRMPQSAAELLADASTGSITHPKSCHSTDDIALDSV